MTQGHGRAQPNVLVVMSDQQQAATVDPAGPCRTPHLDRLAARGVRFERCYTPSPVCSPARASFMTGLLPHRHGMVDVEHAVPAYRADLVADLPMWSRTLREAGYHTGYYGKWHVERTYDMDAFGFDRSGAYREPGDDYLAHRAALGLDPTPVVSEPSRTVTQPGYRDLPLYGVTDEPPESTLEHFTVSNALTFLDDAVTRNEPWALMVSTKAPHEPYVVPRPFFDLYDPAKIELPASFDDDLADRPAIYRRQQSVWADLSADEFRTATACYYALCSLVDEQVGRLVQRIEDAGQLDDTIVVYTSDHGDLMGAHRLLLKGVPAFDEVYRVPLVVSWPNGIAGGRVVDELVQSHDVAETLAALAGSTLGAHAVDLMPVLRGESATAREAAVAELHGQRFSYTQRVVWQDHDKYVFNAFDYDELYDLADDPGERVNLATDPAYRDRLERMTALMWATAAETDDATMTGAQDGTYRYLSLGPQSASAERKIP
ncbi:sulfatase-like hydrolase/transferase [Solicola gregarius]|uniref:Sulfatase-like hydrolase/transferase n=1 Tax=Solicola gregarius TaxID=2908642 RepID=A0AA46THQ8_9ACTN|nr:sulfatase-like hydrolase/transferase [Solicola gregarius]UYM05572.1 sulfatase-like hydrolase/transferase [Solicola gregarius]